MPTKPKKKNHDHLERLSYRLIEMVGTPWSILAHTLLFASVFSLGFFGIDFDHVLLLLTTAVSLEAIYLAIFIQMAVNRSNQSLEEVEDDIEEIQDEVKDLGQDVDEISDDLDKIQEKDLQEDLHDARTEQRLERIQHALHNLMTEIEQLRTIDKSQQL